MTKNTDVHTSSEWGSELNDEQRAVVFAGEGPILVIAGAGSGKTRTLTYRVAHLVREGIRPEQILLCTFTNKAAQEMVMRVERVLERSAEDLWAGTFHSIANRILRRHADRLGFGPNYTILDRDDSARLIDSCIARLGFNTKGSRFPKGSALTGLFGLANSTHRRVDQVIDASYPKFENIMFEIAEVADAYRAAKLRANSMDFDDLLVFWDQLLTQHADLQRLYSEYFKHILVDEYQDTNPLQASIIQKLSATHRNITAVGDDAQSIYRFRGADCRHILEFSQHYPDSRTFYLRTNYRSTPEILDVSNRVIAYNDEQFPKELVAHREKWEVPDVLVSSSGQDEAEFIVECIQDLHDNHAVPYREMAALYRIHSHSLELQLALQRAGVPFAIRSGQRFFEQAHVKDVLSFLRILYNPQDMVAWLRFLPLFPGIGPATVKKIWSHLEGHEYDPYCLESVDWQKKLKSNARGSIKRIVELFDTAGQADYAENVGAVIRLFYEREYEDHLSTTFENAAKRAEDLMELSALASSFEDIGSFLSEMMLQIDPYSEMEDEKTEDEEDAFVLTTVHQAKGLEWEVVFVLNLTEGAFPFFMALHEEGGEEEERRLFYVAATRAKDELYFCTRQYVQSRNGARRADPSRFLWEMHESREENRGYINGTLTEFLLQSEGHPLFDLHIL